MLFTLLGGNTNLIDAVNVLSGREIEKPLRETAAKVMGVLKKGGGFAEALAYASGKVLVFPERYRGLIRSAEKTGRVDAALARIAGDLRRKMKARETITAAMMYPVTVAIIALSGTIVLIYRGIPFFAESGILSGAFLSRAVASVIFAGIYLFAAGVLLTFTCYKLFIRESACFSIFYELSFLLEGDISLPEALTSCITTAGENKWGRALALVKRDIISGGRVAAAFEGTGIFPAYITGWLNIGDKNGEIKTVCRRIAEYYLARDERRREIVIRCMEPLFIAITGIYLLILIQGVVLPILTRAGGFI
jgi:type IV pilus assembly protein PilC